MREHETLTNPTIQSITINPERKGIFNKVTLSDTTFVIFNETINIKLFIYSVYKLTINLFCTNQSST